MLTPKGMKTLKFFHLVFIMMWTVGVVMIYQYNGLLAGYRVDIFDLGVGH